MPSRSEKSIKYSRWKFFFADHASLKKWKSVLRDVVASLRTEVECRDLSNKCVEVVWRSGVAYDNAHRLIEHAKRTDKTFKVLTVAPVSEDAPVIGDDVGSGIGPDAASAGQMLHQPLARCSNRRLTSKTLPDDAASNCLPLNLLLLKALTLDHNSLRRPSNHYQVDRTKVLGRGSFAVVYGGKVQGKQVAVKLFQAGALSDAEDNRFELALHAVMRYDMVQCHSNIVKLLDIELFHYGGKLDIGLVYERYDTDVEQLLKKRPLKIAGIRHVLGSAVAALAHLHQLGLIYMNLTPKTILLRGEGLFKSGWQRLCRENQSTISVGTKAVSADGRPAECGGHDESCEMTYQLDSCFKVSLFHIQIFHVRTDVL